MRNFQKQNCHKTSK